MPSLRQLFLLFRVAEATAKVGSSARAFRSLRLSGLLLAISGVASVILVAQVGARDAADIVGLRIMAYACWLYGAFGLWTLLKPEALSEEPAALCLMRGQHHDPHVLRAVGIARRLAYGMCFAGLPGLLAAAAVSQDLPMLAQRSGLVLVATFYLVSLAVVLGFLGSLSVRSVPRAPRTFALLLTLVPFGLNFLYAGVPSIPGLYIWGLRRMINWGASVS